MNNKNILLVEDEAIIALAKKNELEKYNYTAAIVNTGEEAIEYVYNDNHDIDLILMDIDLGAGIDGTQAAKAILENIEIPIVFYSSHSEPEIVEKTEKITSYGYVEKSSSITVLDASIKMAFKLFDAKMKLQQSKNNIEFILNSINDAVIFQDLNTGNIIDVNHRMLEMYGYKDKEEVIGKTIEPFCSQEQGCTTEKGITYIKKASSGKPQLFEWHAKRKNGTTFWVEVNLKVAEIENKRYIFAVVRDIGDRKHA